MRAIKFLVWCVVLAGFGVALSGCGINIGNTPQKKYVRDVEISGAMAAGRTLNAVTSNGNIKVAGADEAKCVVKAKITARGWSVEEAQTIADGVEISLVEKGGTTEVFVKKPDSELSKHIGISFDITVPKESALSLRTSNGSVSTSLPITVVGKMSKTRLKGTIGEGEGNIRLHTSNGSISIN